MNDSGPCVRLRDHIDSRDHIPTQIDAEATFRDILRWIGENPDRDGLRETPRRLVKAFSEYFSGYRQDPEQILQKTFEETEGYDEMVILRGYSVRKPLRASRRADHRARLGGVCAAAPRRRYLQTGAGRRGLRQAAADPRAPDGTDRQHH